MPITLTGSRITQQVTKDKVQVTRVRMENDTVANDADAADPKWVVDFVLYGTDVDGNRYYGEKTFTEKFQGGAAVLDRIETALANRLENLSDIDTAVVT